MDAVLLAVDRPDRGAAARSPALQQDAARARQSAIGDKKSGGRVEARKDR